VHSTHKHTHAGEGVEELKEQKVVFKPAKSITSAVQSEKGGGKVTFFLLLLPSPPTFLF
jgi:hypothetical protein